MNDIANDSCERVRGRLEGLLLGELDTLGRERDEGHLEACSACRAERAAALRLVEDLRAPEDDLAFALAGLDARLARVLVPRGRARLVRGAVFQAVLTAAAALLALLALDSLGVFGAGLDLAIRRPGIARLEALDDVWRRGIEPLVGGE